jgi:hypothetical protein
MCVVCDEPETCDRAAAVGPPLISLVGAHRPSAGRAAEHRHQAENAPVRGGASLDVSSVLASVGAAWSASRPVVATSSDGGGNLVQDAADTV